MVKRISFGALGGLGEIGLNSYIYNIFDDNTSDILMVDLGMGFNDNPRIPVDTMYPDIDYVINSKANIKGLVITHGHEDHIGAIPYIAERLNCPIYATPWVLDLIISKLKEHKLENKIKLIEVNTNQDYQIGDFKVRWIPISHSIPQSNLLLLQTPLGNMVHSGDFKINKSDTKIISSLKDLQKYKIQYLFCDSTNVLEKGRTQDEESIIPDLSLLIKNATGACWITLFSSNLERVANVCKIAKSLKKKIVLLGRSLENYTKIGIKHHILENDIFISSEEAENFDRKSLIFLATGGQGEYRSVLFNVIINDSYPKKIEDRDCVIFSSRVIPGNEAKVNKYYNLLSLRDIPYYTDKDYHIHVSGHPKQEELKMMYDYIKPKYIVPMHGEIQHLKSHSKFAFDNGYNSFVCLNGDIVELFTDSPEVIGIFTPNKKTMDGNRLVDMNDMFLKTRSKLFEEGCILVSAVFINNDFIEAKISPMGLLNSIETEQYIPQITEKLNNFLHHKTGKERLSKNDLEDEVASFIKKYFKEKLEKKPIVKVHLLGY